MREVAFGDVRDLVCAVVPVAAVVGGIAGHSESLEGKRGRSGGCLLSAFVELQRALRTALVAVVNLDQDRSVRVRDEGINSGQGRKGEICLIKIPCQSFSSAFTAFNVFL